jgi:hypothetical protein
VQNNEGTPRFAQEEVMSSDGCRRIPLLPLVVALAAGCGSKAQYLDVGTDDGGAGGAFSGGDADVPDALTAQIEENHIAVTFVTLSCSDACATVQAVAAGGNPPYRFAWDDGTTDATLKACPTSTKSYAVTVTDTATTGELGRAAETARASLTANVIACPDGGSPDDAGGGPPVYWATWAAPVTGSPGSAQGVLSPPGGDVQVTFAGEVGAGSAKTGGTTVSGVGPVTFLPATTYESATVPNPPPSSGMMAIWGVPSLTQTITFSVPVRDALIAVVALNETWTLSAPPTLLSSGPNALPFNVPGAMNTPTLSGTTLSGVDGNGVLELPGAVTSFTFTVPTSAAGDFTGFTVGIRGRN